MWRNRHLSKCRRESGGNSHSNKRGTCCSMVLWTVIADYRGGTYISQVRASGVTQALKQWAKCLTIETCSIFAERRRATLASASLQEATNTRCCYRRHMGSCRPVEQDTCPRKCRGAQNCGARTLAPEQS